MSRGSDVPFGPIGGSSGAATILPIQRTMPAAGGHAMAELRSKLLFRMWADLAEAQDVGAAPHGHRRIYYVTGGAFEGAGDQGRGAPGRG